MKTSENIAEIAKALATAQGNFKNAEKDSMNPHLKNKYADFTSVWDAIRKPLSTQGIAVLQDVLSSDQGVEIITKLIHSSGQWIEFGPFCVPLTKKDAQGIGSATSYGKRYALCAALGITSGENDDDGEAAVSKTGVSTPHKEVPSKFLSKEQIEELSGLLAQCTHEDQKEIMEKASRPPHNAKTLAQLPANVYEGFRNYVISKIKTSTLELDDNDAAS